MIEISFYDGRGFARIRFAKFDRVDLEGKKVIRLTFSDSKNNYVQVDLEKAGFYEFRKWLNERKDI